MTYLSENSKTSFIRYYYFLFAIGLIIQANYSELLFLTEDWASLTTHTLKDPGIWIVALFLFFINIDAKRVFSTSSNFYDLLYLAAILVAILIAKENNSILLPVLLLSSFWYYSSSQNKYPMIVITGIYLLNSLPYPFYYPVVEYLQISAIYAIEFLLNALFIPALVQEFYIAIPGGQFEIAEGCSGFTYLSINLLLLFLYSILSKFRLSQFAIALIFTIAISQFLNWIRILVIVVVAHNWGFDVPFFVKEHVNFGWVVFALFLVPFFYTLQKIDKMKMTFLKSTEKGNEIELNVPSIVMMFPILILMLI